jgi:hypothetical protein
MPSENSDRSSERDTFLKFIARVAEDKRLYQALRAELAQRKRIFVPAPDCSDLIRKLHLEDPAHDRPADACIRYYFDHAAALLLTPAWAYEVLEYFYRVIVGNIGHLADGGTKALFARYKEADQFVRLYRAGDIRSAHLLYANASSWKQVLAFTQAENVEFMLRKPLLRLAKLIAKGRFKRVADFEGGADLVEDDAVYQRILKSISMIRGRADDRWKNSIDARSIAIVHALAERNASEHCFSAVTVTAACRDGYYNMLDACGAPMQQYAYVRSPFAEKVKQRLPLVMPADRERYLDRAIASAEQLIRLAKDTSYSTIEVGPHLALDAAEEAAYRANHRFGLEATLYAKVYQRPLHVGIPGLPPATIPTLPRPLSAKEAVDMLDADDRFRDGMALARDGVREAARETVEATAPFVTRAKSVRVEDKDLGQLVDSIRRGCEAI